MIRILGLDPGSLNLGFGLVESDKGRLRHVAHGTLHAPKNQPLPGRLALLYDGLQKVLEEFPPDAVALERVFTARNPHSALTLGHARGVVLLAVGQRQLELAEYSPGEVKLAVGGHGRASKHQLAQMVGRLLEVSTKDMSSDSSDALAIAICHCHGLARSRLLARVERSR